uniref:Uncharacterized protein n=1 Tax=Anguilla anguilla TaxID=7936 RepID=A0A0E9TEU6_ANGAN
MTWPESLCAYFVLNCVKDMSKRPSISRSKAQKTAICITCALWNLLLVITTYRYKYNKTYSFMDFRADTKSM